MSNEHNNSSRTSKNYSHSKHSSHHSHHRHSSEGYKRYLKEEEISSEMERKGKNIIYKNVRKEKIYMATKRILFCIIFISLIAFIIITVFKDPESNADFKLFDSNASQEKIIELENKVTKYEYYIEELEERLSQYEDVLSILE